MYIIIFVDYDYDYIIIIPFKLFSPSFLLLIYVYEQENCSTRASSRLKQTPNKLGSNKTALSGSRKRSRNISSCSKRPNADDNNDDNAAESQGDPEFSFLEDSSIQTDIEVADTMEVICLCLL